MNTTGSLSSILQSCVHSLPHDLSGYENTPHPVCSIRPFTMDATADGCSYPAAQRAERLITAHAVVAVVGSLACLVTIVLIAVTRTYRTQIHRLRLYLAVACLLFAVTLGFETLPVDFNKSNGAVSVTVRQGWNGACTAVGFFAQYFAYSKTLAIVWVSFYIFAVAILKKELHKPSREIAGVLTVFLLPALITWVPLVGNTYGLTGTWCWIRSTCNASYPLGTPFQLGLSLVPAALLHMVSLTFIVPVILLFCKRAVTTANGRHKRQQNFEALKETAPLLVYPTLYSLLVMADTLYTICLEAGLPSSQFDVAEMTIISLYQLFALALPASFLLHPSVQRILASRCGKSLDESIALHYGTGTSYTPLVSKETSSS